MDTLFFNLCFPRQKTQDDAMNNLSCLLWTDALCTTQPGSSGQREQHPPALTEEVSESASLHHYGRSAQPPHLLEIIQLDSEQPEIE